MSSDSFELYRHDGQDIEQSSVQALKDAFGEKFGPDNKIEVKNDGRTIFLGLEGALQTDRDSIVATALSKLQSIGIELRDLEHDGGDGVSTEIELADQTQMQIPAPAVTDRSVQASI